MVKIRQDLPVTNEGAIDIAAWAKRVGQSRSKEEEKLLLMASEMSLQSGGHHLTNVQESCIRQGLLTAETLLSLEPDIATILAAILYYPVQFGELSADKVEQTFGIDVRHLVSGVMQITAHTTHAKGRESRISYENLRKMLLAVVEDVRIVLIKLAERICTLRAASVLNLDTRRHYALEARDIYAPLANRLGIGQIKWELEDYAFRYLEPEAYKMIADLLDEKRLNREIYISNVVNQIKTALQNEHIESDISGRAKHIYSIWRKMIHKHLDFQEIYDVRAIRILVPAVRDCYAALGIIHAMWKHIPHEFDDYIATPKENGYRSLHTAVIGPEGKTLEVQIRTFDMHQEAELGVAAHWVYKEGGRLDERYQRKLNSLRQIIDTPKEGEEITTSEALIQEVLDDRVYVFTPRGDVVDMPMGATPLDFAYHIHSDVGNSCRGAKVNGAIVSLNTQLHSGDQVEILSIKSGTPSRDWLSPHLGYLKTARARAKVHQWFKKQDKDKNLSQGREIFEKECRRLGITEIDFPAMLDKLHYKNQDELYVAIGAGDIGLGQVVNALHNEPEPSESITTRQTRHIPQETEITIQGLGNLLCHFGRCCKPLPGDPIIGFITLGRGITVHRQDCVNVLSRNEQDKRLIQVEWGDITGNYYPVDIHIRAYDRRGLLRDITSVLSHDKVNVIGVNTLTNRDDNMADLTITLEIPNLETLMDVLKKISQLPNVLDVQRLHVSRN